MFKERTLGDDYDYEQQDNYYYKENLGEFYMMPKSLPV